MQRQGRTVGQLAQQRWIGGQGGGEQRGKGEGSVVSGVVDASLEHAMNLATPHSQASHSAADPNCSDCHAGQTFHSNQQLGHKFRPDQRRRSMHLGIPNYLPLASAFETLCTPPRPWQARSCLLWASCRSNAADSKKSLGRRTPPAPTVFQHLVTFQASSRPDACSRRRSSSNSSEPFPWARTATCVGRHHRARE